MIAFLDTSALFKLFVPEQGSRVVRELVADVSVAASGLTYVESRAAFARLRREGSGHTDEASRFFDGYWPTLNVVALGPELLKKAADLCDVHPLRAGDAIQLASALSLRDEGLPVTFVCSDSRLLVAAYAQRLSVLNPEAAP